MTVCICDAQGMYLNTNVYGRQESRVSFTMPMKQNHDRDQSRRLMGAFTGDGVGAHGYFMP